MSSPGFCAFSGDPSDFREESCVYLYFGKKSVTKDGRYTFAQIPVKDPRSLDIARYRSMARDAELWIMSLSQGVQRVEIAIEGYSFGSKGRVFQIAEHQAILLSKFYDQGWAYRRFAPAEIKKAATGSGNANKLKMFEQFQKDSSTDLLGDFGLGPIKNDVIESPVNDLVDAYYAAKLLASTCAGQVLAG